MRKPRKTRRRRGAALISAAAATATACSSGHKTAATTTTQPSTTITTVTTTTAPPTTLPPTEPLTGLAPTDPSQLQNPAVVVKIDNVDDARPQTGLDQADLVYEAEVEGGLTRLAAVFQSRYPTVLGPVRSGRLTDEGIIDDLDQPVFVYAGANAIFDPILHQQPATVATETTNPALFRRIGNNVPHNDFTNVAAAAQLSTSHTAPVPLFSYLGSGQAFGGAGVAPAGAVSFSFPAASVGWTYNPAAGVWYRTQNGTADLLADGAQIGASNVVIEFINYITSGIATGEGVAPAPIPEGVQTGGGQAWFFTGGKVVRGNWTRDSLTTPAKFTDSAGAAIPIQPGATWIELAPNGTIPAVTP